MFNMEKPEKSEAYFFQTWLKNQIIVILVHFWWHFLIGEPASQYIILTKDLRGNTKPGVSPDWTGPDRNRSGIGTRF